MSVRMLLPAILLLATAALAQQPTSAAAQAGNSSAQDQPSVSKSVTVECLPFERASEALGKHGCIVGKIVKVAHYRGTTYLNFCSNYRDCAFQGVVLARDSDTIGDLGYLQGRMVFITGSVQEYRGHAEIVITDKKQIHPYAASTPAQFDAAQPLPSGNGQSPHHSKRDRAW